MGQVGVKILQVNNYGYIRGGSDRYFADLSDLLVEKGHSVAALVTRDERNAVPAAWEVRGFQPENVRATDVLRYFYSFDAKKVAQQLVSEWKPDLVHLHIYYGQITPSILGVFRSEGIPIVQTLHEYKLLCPVATMVRQGQTCDFCCNGAFWNAAVNRCNRGSFMRSVVTSLEAYSSRWMGAVDDVDHFIAVSEFVRNTMIRYGINEQAISTVHNFIKAATLVPSFQVGEYFLYVGRIEEIKGIRTLLSAMGQVPGKLVVVGDGEILSELKEEVGRRALNVDFVGFRSGKELHDLIRGSRCVIVPSEWNETFGLIVLEANALGKPVIASRIGGMQEVVRSGENGILFEAGNVEQLVKALEWVRQNPEQAVAMGRAGRKLAETVFGKDEHYRKIMAIYRRLTNSYVPSNHRA